jgi:hypothetical protein
MAIVGPSSAELAEIAAELDFISMPPTSPSSAS